MDEQLSVRLITALANVWSAIRERHPDVPGVVLLPAPGTGNRRVLGHFSALRWRAERKSGVSFHEVVVIAEHLHRSAESVVETLIHEAAHAMNFARGIRDCSRSQYHNKRFRDAAIELGLTVEEVKHYGFAITALPIETTKIYEKEIKALDAVLMHRKSSVIITPPAGGNDNDDDRAAAQDGTTQEGRSRKATCACSHIIRVSRKTIEATVIRCESCGVPFTLV
jgi:hypothetical protein